MILVVCANPAVDQVLYLPGLKPGESQRIIAEKKYPGGKGVHVAMALRELGEQVKVLGFWGGQSGQWICEELEKMGVSCLGPKIKTSTRTCLSFQTEDSFNGTELLEQGPIILADELTQFKNIFEQNLKDISALAISGSVPGGLSELFYSDLISLAHEKSIPVFLDCSGDLLKKTLSQPPKAAQFTAAHSILVHLNFQESAELTAKKTIPEQLQELKKLEIGIALTNGAEGLFLKTADSKSFLHSRVKIAKVISAVGSGDCLLAGIIKAFVTTGQKQDMAALGVACGAANCLREDLGMLYKKDVDKLIGQVLVREVNL